MNSNRYRRTGRTAWSRRVESQLDNVVRMRAGTLWRVNARPRELSIACQRGSVWITQEQDGRDIVLDAGQSFINATSGRLVVQALKESLLRVSRQVLRRAWMPAVVGLAMASAIPVAINYDSGIPGFGIVLAVVLGLFARQVCEELRD